MYEWIIDSWDRAKLRDVVQEAYAAALLAYARTAHVSYTQARVEVWAAADPDPGPMSSAPDDSTAVEALRARIASRPYTPSDHRGVAVAAAIVMRANGWDRSHTTHRGGRGRY